MTDPRNPWDPVQAFAPAIRAAKSRGALCLPQLQFPGRQVPEFLNKHPKSASDVQLKPCLNKTYGKPTPLTLEEIRELIDRYVWAAEVLYQAGADGIIVRPATLRIPCLHYGSINVSCISSNSLGSSMAPMAIF